MTVESPGLEEKVELSVTDVSIQEFLRGIAKTNNININIDPSLDVEIVNNFSNVKVADVLLFLCREYELEMTFVGNIISISKYNPPPIIVETPKYIPKKINVSFNSENDLLTLDLKGDSLFRVTKEITTVTKKNVIFSPELNNKIVSVYIQDMPFDNALDKLAFANDLRVKKTEDNFYLIEKRDMDSKEQGSKDPTKKGKKYQKNEDAEEEPEFNYEAKNMNDISIHADNIPIVDIIEEISTILQISYYLFSDIKGNATINFTGISYEELLEYLFKGTPYTYLNEQGIYLIGERKKEGLRETKVIQFQHRTVQDILPYIPKDITQDVDIKEFTELNSLILSGSLPNILEIEKYIKEIDKVVPVVLIEVIIIDYKSGRTISTGIKAGLGDKPSQPTKGSIFPNLQVDFNANSINHLINSFNGFGLANLGKVTPNFYLSISAMESEGFLKVRSTPKLATLNSHEATMSIGNTEYYLEEQNTVIGTQNPQNITTRQWKSVNANLSITIKPIVSGNEQITLDIKVNQSDFTSRISPDAPPGSVTRSFSSFIRVKNEEMVLLGGLEDKSVSNTGSGVPFLARIPVIKWLFSNKTREKSKTKLNIFIKPIILY